MGDKRIGSRFTRGKKLLAVTAASLVLHGGIIATAPLINKFFNIVPQTSMLNEGAKTEERKQLLKKLKSEKKAFVTQLFNDLKKGNYIPISDFLIKSYVLDENISKLESGQEKLIDEEKIREKYSKILEGAIKETERYSKEEKKLEAIHQFAHFRIFRAYFKDSSFLDVFEKGFYNCSSSTMLVTALEVDIIGSDKYGIVLLDPTKEDPECKSGHMRNWYKNKRGLKEIENTDGEKPVIRKFHRGLRVPNEILIVGYLLQNGIEIDELPKKFRRLYAKGAYGGLPIAGVETKLPCPPPEPIPNPYFKDEIVKKARVYSAMRSLFEEPENIDIENFFFPLLLWIPEDVDWCEIAENEEWHFQDEWFRTMRPYEESKTLMDFSRFFGATRMATLFGDERSKECTREAAYKEYFERFKKAVKSKEPSDRIVFGGAIAMLDPVNARELLLRDFQNETDPKMQSMYIRGIAYVASSEDFEFFKDVLNNNEYWKNRAMSVLALQRIGSPEAEKVLFSAFETEKDEFVKIYLIFSLARLGHPDAALDFIERAYGEKKMVLSRKRVFTNVIIPASLDDKQLKKVEQLIEEENDIVTKARLIAIFGNAGEIEKAVDYAEEFIFSELRNKSFNLELAKGVVLSIGELGEPTVKEKLLSISRIHPGLIPEIGDVFARKHFKSKELTKKLVGIYTDLEEDLERREYVALILVEMGYEFPKPIK